MPHDENKLQQFMNKMVGDMSTAMGAALVHVGDRLGLYKAMAGGAPVSSEELARRTETNERYVREWLAAQAAAGYVEYDAASECYSLPPEQELAFAAEGSPVFVPGAFEILMAVFSDTNKIIDAFKTGRGVGWHEHDPRLFSGTERFFRPGYAAHLVSEWIPALEGVPTKLEHGATVADVGCGHGSSTIVLAKAFPKSQFVGFDYHEPSLERARQAANDADVSNVQFERALAKDYPRSGYDLGAFFDCLHDMGDPVGASAHVRETLDAEGTWMIVEPFAHDTVQENLNPLGRMFYSASTMICTPASKAQEIGLGLGTQAGEKRIREVVMAGGFKRSRRVTQTPFNLVLEARP